MRKLIFITLLVSLISLPLLAAERNSDHPKAEIFGGYQFTHTEGQNANGWNAAVTGNANSWFGITGDFSGAYANGGHIHTFMFGPTITARSQKVNVFAHTLFGGANDSSTTVMSMAFGGGVDAKVAKNVAFRVGQVDWMLFHDSGVTSKKNVRLSTGIVFQF